MFIHLDRLILNKENIDDTLSHFLDFDSNIAEGKFTVEVNDKRDDFPFKMGGGVRCQVSDITLVGGSFFLPKNS